MDCILPSSGNGNIAKIFLVSLTAVIAISKSDLTKFKSGGSIKGYHPGYVSFTLGTVRQKLLMMLCRPKAGSRDDRPGASASYGSWGRSTPCTSRVGSSSGTLPEFPTSCTHAHAGRLCSTHGKTTDHFYIVTGSQSYSMQSCSLSVRLSEHFCILF